MLKKADRKLSLGNSFQQVIFFSIVYMTIDSWCTVWAAWIYCYGSAGSWIRWNPASLLGALHPHFNNTRVSEIL